MMTLDQVKAQLKDMNLKAVADASGVHYNAVYRLVNGGTNPSYETVQKIVSYLENRGKSDV